MNGFGPIGTPELIVILGLLIATAAWVWSLVHCIKNKALSDTNRIIGIVVIIVLGILGSIVYLFLPKEDESGK